ncbi:IS630 transposase-related protein [[Leptolyngbya] sp. PCC 7376]|uniref:IS630 transposase-related protein n=1 Tax=[Leptolyngbya] sp. PCC 7376 TaxID=111781 RepID=UPI0005A1207D|nr:IS630 transposase-related protein [[Leptolyngbya] sp. PCC 7376]
MPAAYSLDLRTKAVAAVDQGQRKSHICRTFNITRNTLDLWLKRRATTGSLTPKMEYHHGPRLKIDDLKAFCIFAQKYSHLTRKEMAQLWPTSVSTTTIGIALRSQNVTRKKTIDTKSEMNH